MTREIVLWALLCTVLLGVASAAETGAGHHLVVTHDKLAWGPMPPQFPAGAQLAVVQGDPGGYGFFVVRARFPAGYKVPPHWHPTTENLTVLSGVVALGMGDTFDPDAMTNLSAGGYAVLPTEQHHSFLARTAATFQIHGVGPFAITYVNPADDPRNASKP